MEYAIIAVVLLFLFGFNHKANYYSPKWFVFALMAAGFLSYQVYTSSNWQFSILYFYILSSALFCSIFDFANKRDLFIQLESGWTGLAIFSGGIIFCALDGNMIDKVFSLLPFLIIGNLIFKLIPRKYRMFLAGDGTKVPFFGLGGNMSADSTLVSIMIAMILTREYPFYLKEISVVSAIVCFAINKASAGLFGFAAAILIYTFFGLKFYALGCAELILGALIVLKYRHFLLNDSGRIKIWVFINDYIISFMNPVVGIGSGAFKAVIQNKIEKHKDAQIGQHIWAHSDILQFYCENGLLGASLMMLFLVGVIWGASVNEWIIGSCIFINLVFNFPAHMAPDTFLILVFIKKHFLSLKGV